MRRIRTKVAAALAALAVVGGVNVALANPAAAVNCTLSGVYVGLSQYQAGVVEAWAILPDCTPNSNRGTLHVQRLWGGWYPQEMATVAVYSNGSFNFATYNCTGTGTYKYRALFESRPGGTPVSKTTPWVSKTC